MGIVCSELRSPPPSGFFWVLGHSIYVKINVLQ
nr:MAG TPA: hypothetical protein [Caudoviricetes sp.]